MLTDRWYPLRPHPAGEAYSRSRFRFNVVPAGRRSGKTERAKRKTILRAMLPDIEPELLPARYFLAAPTRDQAKRIFWDDVKALVPPDLRLRVSETDLMVKLPLAEVWVVGMDKPQRIEGSPWDGGVLDEYGNMKPQAWGENVRPALSDRGGWCDFIGVPEGRNHYFDLYQYALTGMREGAGDWGAWTWYSSDILPAEEIEAARKELDELTYQQEYEASFITFAGRAYYPFTEPTHCARLKYDPQQPLILCFDFNVAPGVAAVCQEQTLPTGTPGTGVIGEVWIPRNSNTPAVCRRIVADWGRHTGPVRVYGDATGGAPGSAKVAGSDWDLVRQILTPAFGGRISYHIPAGNGPERARVNAVNARLKSADGTVRLMVDPAKAPHVVRDLEGVALLEGGSGEIDKPAGTELTHISDALGYYIVAVFPLQGQAAHVMDLRI